MQSVALPYLAIRACALVHVFESKAGDDGRESGTEQYHWFSTETHCQTGVSSTSHFLM